MTGNGLKDIQSAIRAAGRPISVRPEMEEVRNAVESNGYTFDDALSLKSTKGEKYKMAKIPFGPNYDEMLDPGLLDKEVRAKALAALKQDELDPINLFNITWKDANEPGSQSRVAAGVDGN